MVWKLYAAVMLKIALPSCRTLDDFKALMSEQSENAKMCRDEAPEIANEIRAMCFNARKRLEMKE